MSVSTARFSTSLLVLLAALALAHAAPSASAQPVMDATTRNGLPSLAPMLDRITPAVVNIATVSTAPIENNPLARDPFFRRFFNLPDKPQQQVAAGSGVIVDAARGLVLTNNHVVREAQQIIVTLKDRRQLQAQLVGTDPGTDIAVLRIDAKNLTALAFGDSDNHAVGDYVIAIGNPFGIGQTVTSGIISAVGRTGLTPEGYEDFIQTDASINPGNSGGALVNLRGELIGINTAIIGPSGGNVGIGFAVPSNMVRQVVAQIVKYGEVRRGRLGVDIEDLTPAMAEKLRLPFTEGAILARVHPGSPAEKAGFRSGDVVTAFNGRAIKNGSDLRNRLGLTPVGEEVEMTIVRDGREQKVRALISAPASVPVSGETVPQLAGLRVANHDSGQAVAVTTVDANSPAAATGLRRGDAIVAVARRRVRNVGEFLAALNAIQGQGQFAVTVLRGDTQMTFVIR
jgi:serine protease Do/serine protease DegQ